MKFLSYILLIKVITQSNIFRQVLLSFLWTFSST